VEEHTPKRPSWDCRCCAKTWPCAAAREQLAEEFVGNTVQLSILLWSYLEDWIHDQGPGPFGEAFERFIAWSRPLVVDETVEAESDDVPISPAGLAVRSGFNDRRAKAARLRRSGHQSLGERGLAGTDPAEHQDRVPPIIGHAPYLKAGRHRPTP
jgi:hypothetical protein